MPEKKEKVFLLSANNSFCFFLGVLKPAVESSFGLDHNYIEEDEIRLFFLQLSQRLATIRSSSSSCRETKLFSFVLFISIENLFVLHCEVFLFLLLSLFVLGLEMIYFSQHSSDSNAQINRQKIVFTVLLNLPLIGELIAALLFVFNLKD